MDCTAANLRDATGGEVMRAAKQLPRTRANHVLRVRSNGSAAALAAVTTFALVGAAALGFNQNALSFAAGGQTSVDAPGSVRAIELPGPAHAHLGAGSLTGGSGSGAFGGTGGLGGPGISTRELEPRTPASASPSKDRTSPASSHPTSRPSTHPTLARPPLRPTGTPSPTQTHPPSTSRSAPTRSPRPATRSAGRSTRP